MIYTLVVLAAAGATLFALLRPRLGASTTWRATVTPLASIIGSGFLVVAPLLALSVGGWAPVAMLSIVVLALWVGSAIRVSIREIEPKLGQGSSGALNDLDELSRIVLGFAYVISVSFYLRLMASFILRDLHGGELAARLLATGILLLIAAVGWFRGLHGMENIEELAVSTNLAVISGLLLGLVAFSLADIHGVVDSYGAVHGAGGGWHTVRVLAGTLLVVQGFETSRYLGDTYEPALRARTMLRAQVISGVIYVVFVGLVVQLFNPLPQKIDETSILAVVGDVSVVLAPMLVLGAVASQLSASVADTAGGGGMLMRVHRHSRSARSGYVAVALAAIAVVWFANVFAIVSLASRAFAAYYLTQTVMVILVVARERTGAARTRGLASYGGLAAVLLFVVLFAIPAG